MDGLLTSPKVLNPPKINCLNRRWIINQGEYVKVSPLAEGLIGELITIISPVAILLVLLAVYKYRSSKSLLKKLAVLLIILWIALNMYTGAWFFPDTMLFLPVISN